MSMTLKDWRKEKGFTQTELADAIKGIVAGKWRQSHVAAWENGTVPGGLPMAAITKLTKGKVTPESFVRKPPGVQV